MSYRFPPSINANSNHSDSSSLRPQDSNNNNNNNSSSSSSRVTANLDESNAGGSGAGSTFALSQPVQLSHPLRPTPSSPHTNATRSGLLDSSSSLSSHPATTSDATSTSSFHPHALHSSSSSSSSSMASAIHPGSASTFHAIGAAGGGGVSSSATSSPAVPGSKVGHGSVSAMEIPSNFGYTHRRNETAPAHFDFGYGGPPPPLSQEALRGASSGTSSGALRIHQFFPDAGEPGVPVTILISVRASWARDVGLWLTDGRYGGSNAMNFHNRATSHLVVSFGSVDAETRADRSMGAAAESPISSFTPLPSMTSSSSSSSSLTSGNDRILDLTVVAHAPSYPTQATSARVPLRLRLVGSHIDPAVDALSSGVDLGFFHYWQVSRRGSLKRQAEDYGGGEPSLRRPASFPVLNTNTNSAAAGMTGAPGGATTGPATTTAAAAAVGGGSRTFLQPGMGQRAQTFGRASGSTAASAMQHQHQHQRGVSHSSDAREISSTPSSAAFGPVGGDFTFSMSGYDEGRRDSWTPMPQAVRPSTAASTATSTMAMFSPPPPVHAQTHDALVGAPAASSASQSSSSAAATVPPRTAAAGNTPPQLIRASQVPPPAGPGNVSGFFMLPEGPSSGAENTMTPTFEDGADGQTRATLAIEGDLNDMAMGWSEEEYRNGRRLVQFWRRQTGTVIQAAFQPVRQQDYQPNTIAVSCIFRADKNECFITSVDTIYLLEALVESRFTVEEKNRIRRNLEGLRPITISKGKRETEEFFKLIMGFPDPKPRHIEKDIKVFPWRVVGAALHKIISKYRAVYGNQGPAAAGTGSGHGGNSGGSGGGGALVSGGGSSGSGYPGPRPSAPTHQAATGSHPHHEWQHQQQQQQQHQSQYQLSHHHHHHHHHQQQHQHQHQQQQQQQHASMPAMLSRHEHSDSSDSSKSLATPPNLIDARLSVDMQPPPHYHAHSQYSASYPAASYQAPSHQPFGTTQQQQQQQQQQQHQHQRQLPPPHSSSVAGYDQGNAPSSATPATSSSGLPSAGLYTPQHYSSSLQQSPSSRRFMLGGGGGSSGLGSSSLNFNFSDFVVSPVAFGNTPLQHAQAQAMQQHQQAHSGNQPPPPQQPPSQPSQQHRGPNAPGSELIGPGSAVTGGSGAGSSLGVDLGEARGSHSYRM